MLTQIRALPPTTYVRAIPIALLAALLIAIPSDLLDTPFFGRPVPTRPIDYVILTVTSALIGLTLAVRPAPVANADDGTSTIWAGFVSFLAVGCPVCNQAVVALVGASGALAWWAPVQPFVGLAAIGMIVYALRRRLLTYDLEACPIPTPTSSRSASR